MATKKSESTKMSREQAEYNRLSVLYERIPANKRALVDGLLVQAARLRVSLDDLYADLQKNGNTEMFKQAYTETPSWGAFLPVMTYFSSFPEHASIAAATTEIISKE